MSKIKLQKRTAALITSSVMFMSLMPSFTFTAAAENGTWTGEGTEGKPYLIEDLADLEALASNVKGGKTYEGVYFKLENSIDMSDDYNSETGKSWTPIGGKQKWTTYEFCGIFDGQNNTVKGLYYNREADKNLKYLNYVGLFGYLGTGGKISNLSVENSYVNGYQYVGGVCGYSDGIITNCHSGSSVTVKGGYQDIGGVCGYNTLTLTSCSNAGSVSGEKYYVGGVCGLNLGTITECFNIGEVTNSNNYVGGVAGRNSKELKDCYNTGSVSGNNYVGGVCGDNNGGAITSTFNYTNEGSVIGASVGVSVGAVCGFNTGTIKNSYFVSGDLDGVGIDNVGGIEVTGKSDEFSSGEIAYLLNGNSSNGVWKQTIGKASYPQFTGLNVYCDGAQYYNIADGYTNTVLKKFTGEDNSTATAVRSDISPSGNVINRITWEYNDYSGSYNGTEISGNSTVYFGIIVPALLKAAEGDTTDEITVTIE